MLNFENIGDRFVQVVHTSEWEQLQEKYNQCDDIYVLGHGGNMAVADHAAVDMTPDDVFLERVNSAVKEALKK